MLEDSFGIPIPFIVISDQNIQNNQYLSSVDNLIRRWHFDPTWCL